jgi:DNA relaxase NicK
MDALARSDYFGGWEEMRPLKGYHTAAQFVVGGESIFKIQHGGQNEQYGANVIGSGGSAQRLAEIVRQNFPSHRVSRVDSCEDYHHPDVYEYLRERALKIAEASKLDVREITKPIASSDDGKTLYLGSPSSAVTMRIYEKGKQLGCSTDWVRAELQVRPKKDAKLLASLLSAEQLWGFSKWSALMALEMGKTDAQRVDVNAYQKSDQERAYRFMLKQYGPMLSRLMPHHGSWEALGAQIGYDWDHRDDLKDKIELRPVKRE